MEEKICNEKRAALIAALIAIPSAIFISMAVHHFVPVEEKFPVFDTGEVTPPPPAFKGKGPSGMEKAPPAPGMNKAGVKAAFRARREALLALAGKKAKAAERNLALAKSLHKAGKVKVEEVILLTEKSLLAEGALYRLENRIRNFRSSISDLAVRYESTKRLLDLAKRRNGASLEAGKLEYEVLDLAFQLQSNRLYSNPVWKSAYDAYCKAPGKKSYLEMLEKEREVTPRRRF